MLVLLEVHDLATAIEPNSTISDSKKAIVMLALQNSLEEEDLDYLAPHRRDPAGAWKELKEIFAGSSEQDVTRSTTRPPGTAIKGKCWQCGKTGHRKQDCRSSRNPSKNTRTTQESYVALATLANGTIRKGL